MTFRCEALARFRQHLFERAQQQLQRRTELVADVAEERGLCAIDFGQCVRPLPLLLVCPGAGQPDSNVFGDPTNELAVCLIERPARMDSENQEPCR